MPCANATATSLVESAVVGDTIWLGTAEYVVIFDGVEWHEHPGWGFHEGARRSNLRHTPERMIQILEMDTWQSAGFRKGANVGNPNS